MIESFIHEWANLLIRWIHFIVGVAWIGASFYFNWLENNLNRERPQDEGIAGNLWAIHGGGFYHLKKFRAAPPQLPEQLHWFKWEAYATWLSGIALLVVVYYFNSHLFLIDPAVMVLTPTKAIILSAVSIIGSWFVYDGCCRSPLRKTPLLLSITLALYLALLGYLLSEVFSGRAAYIHVGAAIGTIMVGNVFFVIIPAQKEMVAALKAQRRIDPAVGRNGLLRSIHNNYLTLPVLFMMISSHFPSTYGHHLNWLILVCISLASIIVRLYFNLPSRKKELWWMLPFAFISLLLLMWMTAPRTVATTAQSTTIQKTTGTDSLSDSLSDSTTNTMAHAIIQKRCTVCHSESPSQAGFAAAPAGLVMDKHEQVLANAGRIYQAAVLNKTMPIGNLTKMTQGERDLIAQWYNSLP